MHLTREAIQKKQLEALRLALAECLERPNFAQQQVHRDGLDPWTLTIDDFTSVVSFVTKDQIAADQCAHPPYGTRQTRPLSEYTRYHQTSGTTGQPLRWLDTPEGWDWMLANWREVFAAAGVSRDDGIMFTFSFGPFIGFWLAFEAALQMGCLCLPGGGMSSAARLKVMVENRVTVLCCTPTYALRLGEVAAAEGIDLADIPIRRVIVAGEPGAAVPETRAKIEAAWGAGTLFDHHGMTEVGPVSYECPQNPGTLHVMERAFLAEIIDPQSLQPVEPGREGELVLTTLGRTGSPLLRYRTGDLVRAAAGSPCSCGRHELALEGGILGRIDDMVVIRGVNLYPSAVESIVRSLPEIAEYRVEITRNQTLPEVCIQIEPDASCGDPQGLALQLQRKLNDAFSLRIPVTTAQPGGLPRFEMKAKRWVVHTS